MGPEGVGTAPKAQAAGADKGNPEGFLQEGGGAGGQSKVSFEFSAPASRQTNRGWNRSHSFLGPELPRGPEVTHLSSGDKPPALHTGLW